MNDWLEMVAWLFPGGRGGLIVIQRDGKFYVGATSEEELASHH